MNHHWIRASFFVPLLAAALVTCPVDKITGIEANPGLLLLLGFLFSVSFGVNCYV